MPKRGNLLSEFEPGVIQSLTEKKVPTGQIADRLGRSYNCIKNYLLRSKTYTRGGGRPQLLDDRTKRHIYLELIKDDSPTAARLIADLNLNVSKDTVYRNGYKYVPYFKAPLLSPLNKNNRLKWAKKTLLKLTTKKLNLEQVTFLDEKIFLLDGPDGCRKYWTKHNEI
ncbi:hypothetical protein A3Q56_06134 [Intoshia linei]|uniref:Tc3 transposase DNA binding domain-containing protein n=1 Tax=Intoshia linei TaxID=1819745 RepID=A0A177AY78_9BILA|nr:hypothetical protein A3Q56_06134 [Intoshia linei]